MTKLTQEQREQVVELLRCAADLYDAGELTPRATAAESVVGGEWRGYLLRLARDAESEVIGCADDRAWAMLEAAQRVEDGSWP